VSYFVAGGKLKIGERFSPHLNLKRVYYVYLVLAAVIPLILSLLLPLVAFTYVPDIRQTPWPFVFIPLTVTLTVILFAAYWIPRYCSSISYMLSEEEVMVERGVWWKMKHVVPYARVMSVDIIQGPISRCFGVGSVHVHTAGYTGPAGGTAGPGTRGAEATIWGVPNFVDVRNTIIDSVRERPLFAAPRAGVRDLGSEILAELKAIKEILRK
jgi:hypothetical protein